MISYIIRNVPRIWYINYDVSRANQVTNEVWHVFARHMNKCGSAVRRLPYVVICFCIPHAIRGLRASRTSRLMYLDIYLSQHITEALLQHSIHFSSNESGESLLFIIIIIFNRRSIMCRAITEHSIFLRTYGGMWTCASLPFDKLFIPSPVMPIIYSVFLELYKALSLSLCLSYSLYNSVSRPLYNPKYFRLTLKGKSDSYCRSQNVNKTCHLSKNCRRRRRYLSLFS